MKPLFEELKHVIDEYIDWHEGPTEKDRGEPPYWNNENASVSMLVAAGARAGYVVLSDYRTDKKIEGRHVNGRCDLLVGRGGHSLEIEAKATYIREDHRARLDKRLEIARLDAKHLPTKEPCAGLVFAILSVEADQKTFRWDAFPFERMLRKTNADLCWWWRDTKADGRYQWEGRAHPGVAILLKSTRSRL